jgi:hypothetical protein
LAGLEEASAAPSIRKVVRLGLIPPGARRP